MRSIFLSLFLAATASALPPSSYKGPLPGGVFTVGGSATQADVEPSSTPSNENATLSSLERRTDFSNSPVTCAYRERDFVAVEMFDKLYNKVKGLKGIPTIPTAPKECLVVAAELPYQVCVCNKEEQVKKLLGWGSVLDALTALRKKCPNDDPKLVTQGVIYHETKWQVRFGKQTDGKEGSVFRKI
ncbi:hypothetical protein O9K51_06789 [Purpureocillium lavendulum]|uniref:Uncharacterized protein n=1 Tax=Purpureocillium lavendulum TaxID=1247861 RepID=A0AB34FRN7_9HYPO|nr:hypothetical protein O9K51_06789 [Purpureocillium lavendulum]